MITLQSKNDEDTGYSYITLNQALQEGDQIKVSGFQNKNAGGTSGTDKKVVTFKMAFYADETKKGDIKEADNANWVNLFNDEQYADGTAPETRTYDVTAALAGSNIIRIARSKSSTNLFITKIEIVRAVGPVDATFSLSKTALKVGETAKVLVNGSDIYGANFNVPTSLWESAGDGPYISLSADGTVTAVKATPADYCFYFFANSKDAEKYVSKQTTTMYLDITEATPATDVYEVTSNNQEFILSKANITDEANTFVTTSTDDWNTNKEYADYPKADYYNMSKSTRYITFKVKGATNFKLNVQNSTAGRTYTIKVGEGEAQTITHGGDALEYSDVIETGTTGEVTITIAGGGSSVYPISIVFNTTDGSKTFTIGPNGYSTYCGDEKFTVEGATVNTASVNATTGVVTLKAVTINQKSIEPGVGVVLTGEEGAMVTIKPTRNAAASISGNDLVGVNAETTSIDANAYVLSSNDTKTSFIKAGAYGNVTDLMNKAYIVYTGMQEGSLDIQFEGEATAINNVNANDNADSAAPVKVIKNGKLFIGNYNVAGQLVK